MVWGYGTFYAYARLSGELLPTLEGPSLQTQTTHDSVFAL